MVGSRLGLFVNFLGREQPFLLTTSTTATIVFPHLVPCNEVLGRVAPQPICMACNLCALFQCEDGQLPKAVHIHPVAFSRSSGTHPHRPSGGIRCQDGSHILPNKI